MLNKIRELKIIAKITKNFYLSEKITEDDNNHLITSTIYLRIK